METLFIWRNNATSALLEKEQSTMIIGETVFEVDTPALWVDLDMMERNITLMAAYMQSAAVGWRPHTKGIKIPAIAHKLIDAGAIGITCAKLSEAEVMAAAGIKDILVANQVVGAKKVERLIALRSQADVMVAVDNLDNAQAISSAASAAGTQIRVLVELDIGMQRAGIKPGQFTHEFVKQILDMPGIEFAGLMGWEGQAVAIADPLEKQRVVEQSIRLLLNSASLIKDDGIPVQIISCGGSGSFRITAQIPGVTEIQAGGAVFGDETYQKWGAATESSLFVMTTVSSRAVPERAIVDAGRKSLNNEISMPRPQNLEGVELVSLSSEHGVLKVSNMDLKLGVGDKINFVVGYGDWTLFLFDRLLGVRDGKVEIIWDILARGRLT